MSAYRATLRSPNCGCSDERAVGKGLSVFTRRALHNLAKSFSERALRFITDGLGDRIERMFTTWSLIMEWQT